MSRRTLAMSFVFLISLSACGPNSMAAANEDQSGGAPAQWGDAPANAAVGDFDDLSATGPTALGGGSRPRVSDECMPAVGSTSVDAARIQVCQIVNQQRAGYGMGGLAIDARLSAVAQAFAQDMYARGYFGHVEPNGTTMDDRLRDGGVNFGWAGENIARGQATSVDVMTAWMNSAGHRSNILQSHYRKIGVGRIGNVWVQEFSD